MDPEFWRSRWQDRQIGFHEGKPNAYLAKHAGRLADCKRVLVPLCGKSDDLAYLAHLGHEVIGIELVETAVREFFAEHPGVTGVDIIVGDLFAVTRDQVGRIDAIYDRGSMVALPPDLRHRYVAHLRALAPDARRLLLVAVEYPQDQMQGPPFSVPESEVRAEYANAPVELIDQGVDPRGRLGGALMERCYSIELTAARPTP